VEIFKFAAKSRDYFIKKTKAMLTVWSGFPEQIKRLAVVFVIVISLFLFVRPYLIPNDFGKYGHFRASAVDEIAAQNIQYMGHVACLDCHDDITGLKQTGFHRDVSCEVCHGPAVEHIEGDLLEMPAPRERGYCPLCHEYLPSRPTGFPQIISASHNPMEACISCHDAHDPKPPETPKDCDACHGEIANTKAFSKHVNIACVQCHVTPEEHKLRPREVRPGKPLNREFCGQCHAEDADSAKGVPKIDMVEHEERYVCWQCHYPHLPEVN
jgi:hypothetical protein